MKRSKIFIVAIVVALLVPTVATAFAPTESTGENRRLAAFPSVKTETGLNTAFLTELGDWFEDHYAFRNILTAADAFAHSLFGVSSSGRIVDGSDGWLYYTTSVEDSLAFDSMTDEELRKIAHNLEVIDLFARENGSRLVFTVAPNKSTLYPEHLPYYYRATGEQTAVERLGGMLGDIDYVDLYPIFEESEETLYLRTDSHWNDLGAALVFEKLAGAMELGTVKYDEPIKRTGDAGDLARMLYYKFAKREENYTRGLRGGWVCEEGSDPEADVLIRTTNPKAEGSAVVFRDSFGISLFDFFADNTGSLVYSSTQPYKVGQFVEESSPDVILIEKVERNLKDLITNTPVMTCPVLHVVVRDGETIPGGERGENFYDPDYTTFSVDAGDHETVLCRIDGEERACFLCADGRAECVVKNDLLTENTEFEFIGVKQ